MVDEAFHAWNANWNFGFILSFAETSAKTARERERKRVLPYSSKGIPGDDPCRKLPVEAYYPLKVHGTHDGSQHLRL